MTNNNNNNNNNNDNNNNYRPVSLTSMVVMYVICDNQHDGFRPLCVTHLLQLVHECLSILDDRGSVDAIFLDFAKAFDKVFHPYLLLKLMLWNQGSFIGMDLRFLDYKKTNRRNRWPFFRLV